MRFRRDYNRPFFSSRRRGPNVWLLFAYGLLIGGFLVFVTLRYDDLQLQALETIGMAPTATPVASTLAMQAVERYQAGDVTGAIRYYERAVQQQPDDINYLYEYGNALLEDDQYDQAIAISDHAIEVAPDDPRGYALKGRALMWSDPAAAIQVTVLGKDIDPSFAPLYAVQGVAYTNLARYQQGIQEGMKAMELDRTDPFVLRAIYTPLVYTGRYQEAISYLEEAISINPNVTAPYFELAFLYKLRQVNQPEMAVAIYNRILEMDPNNAKAYLRLCETYANVENARFDIAQPYCDRAIEINPDFGDAYMQRGRMQYLRRNYEGSIESFNTCVDFGSNKIECWTLRGIAHFWLGECVQAWDVLTEARVRAIDQGDDLSQIEDGLYNVTQLCPEYANQPTPTPQPTQPPPATPIGGFG